MDELKLFDEFEKLTQDEKFDKALILLEPYKNEIFYDDRFCLKIAIACVLNDCKGHSFGFEDAERFLLRACEISPANPEYLSELGYFHFSLMDNAEKGLEYFNLALNLDPTFQEAIAGKEECIEEIKERNE